MKIILFILSLLIMMGFDISAQDRGALPYEKIPDYPAEYTPGNVAARMVDGLGFRYYWATEGLKKENMAYRPADDVRSIRETMDHIYELSKFLLGSLNGEVSGNTAADFSFDELRAQTLRNFELASKILKRADEGQLKAFAIRRDDKKLPFWYVLNGPLADAIYHTGQVVAFRRAAGNPVPQGVSVLLGVKKAASHQ